MRSVNVQDDLADGFETSALPPIGPDGAPRLESLRELPPEAPRLCTAGPCRHYHRFQIQLDAQNPMTERKPDGTVVNHGRVFHVQTHHYCYPDVGIETNLGALPVLSCNRWVPLTSLLRRKRGIRRQFERELERFVAQQAPAEQPRANGAPVDDKPAAVRLRIGIILDVLGMQIVSIGAPAHFTMREVIEQAMLAAHFESRDLAELIQYATVAIVGDFEAPSVPPGYVEPIDNLDATVEQLELSDGDRIRVIINTGKDPH